MENIEFKTKPYRFQLETYEKSRDALFYALFLERGLGKSKIIIDTINYLYIKSEITTVIILGLKGMYENWVEEINKHLNDNVKRLVTVWKLPITSKLNLLLKDLKRINATGILKIFVGNIDLLSTKKGTNYLFDLLTIKGNECLFIIDESTTIGNPKSIRTRIALELGKLPKYKRILTGTPIADSVTELFTQVQFLNDPVNLLKTKNWYSFRARYCILENREIKARNFKVVKGTKHIDELRSRLTSFSTILSKQEANLDLPEKTYQKYNVELTKEQLLFYKTMKSKSRIELEKEPSVTAKIVLSKIMKLRQIISGFYKDDEGNIKTFSHKRIEALSEILQLNNEKIIIWSNFIYCINEICSYLKSVYGEHSFVRYDGSSKNRPELVKTFTDDGNCRFFVGNQQVGGYGLTLTAASTMVYYTNSFSFKTRLQSEDRIHRIGQSKNVLYIDMRVLGTIDDRIIEILQSKNEMYSQLMGNPSRLKDLIFDEDIL